MTVDNAIACEMVIHFAMAMVNCYIIVQKIVFKKVCNDGMKLNLEGRSRYPKWHYALDHHFLLAICSNPVSSTIAQIGLSWFRVPD